MLYTHGVKRGCEHNWNYTKHDDDDDDEEVERILFQFYSINSFISIVRRSFYMCRTFFFQLYLAYSHALISFDDTYIFGALTYLLV